MMICKTVRELIEGLKLCPQDLKVETMGEGGEDGITVLVGRDRDGNATGVLLDDAAEWEDDDAETSAA